MAQESRSEKIAVIGLGYVGLPVALAFARKYPTLGFDINERRVGDLSGGRDDTGETSTEELRSSRSPFVSQIAPQNTSSPVRNAASICTHRRRTHGTGTGTASRLGARAVGRALVRPFPLIAIRLRPYRFSKRLTMIAPS